jgi:hypothetical protein
MRALLLTHLQSELLVSLNNPAALHWNHEKEQSKPTEIYEDTFVLPCTFAVEAVFYQCLRNPSIVFHSLAVQLGGNRFVIVQTLLWQ